MYCTLLIKLLYVEIMLQIYNSYKTNSETMFQKKENISEYVYPFNTFLMKITQTTWFHLSAADLPK